MLDIKALGLLLVTLVMLYLKYFVKYDLTSVFYHAITYSLFNYIQTKTSAKCINKQLCRYCEEDCQQLNIIYLGYASEYCIVGC